ncbi:hypothetical protein PU708_000013560 [Morganella morganii]|nr:hypothetical protein [Morganella morganii]HCR3199147.1 hypothetical protein [Morganella morganii]HCT8187552.1 hypothetical protein [Morganella morganii]
MSSFALDIHHLLERLINEETLNLSDYDKSLLSHLNFSLYHLQMAENGLKPVYNVSFEDSGHLAIQENAGMDHNFTHSPMSNVRVCTNGHVLNSLGNLYFENTVRYLKDCFAKINLVESGLVIKNMKKDENRREMQKRKKGGKKSHERKEFFKNHICELANIYLKKMDSSQPSTSYSIKMICSEIYIDVKTFLQKNPDLPQSKRDFNHPDVVRLLSRTISDTLSNLRKEGRL